MTSSKPLTSMEISALKVLIYFDLFDHPLTSMEICHFMDQVVDLQQLEDSLHSLIRRGRINHLNAYWGFAPLKDKIIQREDKEKYALSRRSSIKRFSRIVSTFPFVRAVFLTGSYSKGVMNQDSDIDFFIVTDPGKLWTTKFLMVVFRKLFLFDSHRNFCINYLVTLDNLTIMERNVFTATEIVTMIPVYGHLIFHQMMMENSWIQVTFPAYQKIMKRTPTLEVKPMIVLKRVLEILFGGKWTEKLGDQFMQLSAKKYQKQYQRGYSEEEFSRAIMVTAQVSKVHPHFFQKRVLEEYQEKIEDIFDAIQ